MKWESMILDDLSVFRNPFVVFFPEIIAFWRSIMQNSPLMVYPTTSPTEGLVSEYTYSPHKLQEFSPKTRATIDKRYQSGREYKERLDINIKTKRSLYFRPEW